MQHSIDEVLLMAIWFFPVSSMLMFSLFWHLKNAFLSDKDLYDGVLASYHVHGNQRLGELKCLMETKESELQFG
jgi:hypothetical protein